MEMVVDYFAIGQRIKQARKAKGYTQEKLAEGLGVSIVYVSQIENGKTKLNLEMLMRIAHLLDADAGFLLTGAASRAENAPPSDIASLLEGCPPEKRKLLTEIIKVVNKNA
jgi:transcriptional regulator with XRE-family HTH domain